MSQTKKMNRRCNRCCLPPLLVLQPALPPLFPQLVLQPVLPHGGGRSPYPGRWRAAMVHAATTAAAASRGSSQAVQDIVRHRWLLRRLYQPDLQIHDNLLRRPWWRIPLQMPPFAIVVRGLFT